MSNNEDEYEETLTMILSDYYLGLNKIEKLFYIGFIINTSIYAIIFITFLILSGKFDVNYPLIILLIFPIVSGITNVINYNLLFTVYCIYEILLILVILLVL